VNNAGTVAWDEKSVFVDDLTGVNLRKLALTQTYSTKTSVSVVFKAGPVNDVQFMVFHGNPQGIRVNLANTGIIRGSFIGTVATVDMDSAATYGDWAWHCMTVVFDSSGANLGRIYIDGVQDGAADFSGVGVVATSADTFAAAGDGAGNTLYGGMARLRVDIGTAATLADHNLLCGRLWNKPYNATPGPQLADVTFTRTGGTACLNMGSDAATCHPGDLLGLGYSATLSQIGWAVHPALTNRVLHSVTDIDCVDWTCVGAATIAASVAPDGSLTGGSMTHAAGSIQTTAAGYANSTALDLRVWVKCAAGTLAITHSGDAGDWDVDCTHASLNGTWELLDSSHAAVTENAAFASDAGGALLLDFAGADAEVWCPTAVEGTNYLGVCIPTVAAAVATGDITLTVPQAGYYTGTVTTETLDSVNGDCLQFHTGIIDMDGNAGKCSGILQEIVLR
jgi:hypothetical protein